MTDRVSVPCGSCRLCCRMMTPLHPEHGDDIGSYQTALWVKAGQEPMIILDRLPNGDCVYLGENGCTIHERAPRACRMFDCREMFKNSDRLGRRLAVKRGEVAPEIFRRGRELLGA